jgi:hypothetical protein
LHPFVKKHYVQGNERIFEIEGTIDYLTSEPTEIFSICGTVLLGDYEWSNVTLDDIEYQNGYISTISLGGELEIYGVCEFNISRIQLSNRTALTLIRGRGDNDVTIKVSTGEEGEFELAVYTLTGQKYYSTKFNKTNDNYQEFEIQPDISGFPSGFYFIILRSNTGISSKPLIINK